MPVSRRNVLIGAGVLGAAGLALRPYLSANAPSGPQPLRMPPLIDAQAQGGAFSLNVQAGSTEFFPGRLSATLGYNGSNLGPTVRVSRGSTVQASVTNGLAKTTTVHWHGLLIPGPLDGGPHQPIAPGQSWRPLLPIDQPAATLLYHAHVHGLTAEQVYRGLAGLLIVQDDDEQRLGLPGEYGVDDLPLLLQDRQFEDGMLAMPRWHDDDDAGSARRNDPRQWNGQPGGPHSVPAGAAAAGQWIERANLRPPL